MTNPFQALAPDQASTGASQVDALFYTLTGLSTVITLAIAGVIIYFALRYRRREGDDLTMRGVGITKSQMHRVEALWIVVPLAIFLGIFIWGASLFAAITTPPADAMEIYVVGKQWMWKSQHQAGRREINELHVPVGEPVKLIMTSEDVIHSFYIPAFRVKTDVMPGRYTTLWFEATEAGEHHLFCAEYCGTKHAEMIGKVVAMEPQAFQDWLAGATSQNLDEVGEALFQRTGCETCHKAEGDGRGPQLRGLFGKEVLLADGRKVVADESYLRESILDPKRTVVAGYQPIMPTYVSQLSEEDVVALIAYIKSLGTAAQVEQP